MQISADPRIMVFHNQVLKDMVAGTLAYIDAYMLWLLYMTEPFAQSMCDVVVALTARLLLDWLCSILGNMLPSPIRVANCNFKIINVDLALASTLVKLYLWSILGLLIRNTLAPSRWFLLVTILSLVMLGLNLLGMGGMWLY